MSRRRIASLVFSWAGRNKHEQVPIFKPKKGFLQNVYMGCIQQGKTNKEREMLPGIVGGWYRGRFSAVPTMATGRVESFTWT